MGVRDCLLANHVKDKCAMTVLYLQWAIPLLSPYFLVEFLSFVRNDNVVLFALTLIQLRIYAILPLFTYPITHLNLNLFLELICQVLRFDIVNNIFIMIVQWWIASLALQKIVPLPGDLVANTSPLELHKHIPIHKARAKLVYVAHVEVNLYVNVVFVRIKHARGHISFRVNPDTSSICSGPKLFERGHVKCGEDTISEDRFHDVSNRLVNNIFNSKGGDSWIHFGGILDPFFDEGKIK